MYSTVRTRAPPQAAAAPAALLPPLFGVFGHAEAATVLRCGESQCRPAGWLPEEEAESQTTGSARPASRVLRPATRSSDSSELPSARHGRADSRRLRGSRCGRGSAPSVGLGSCPRGDRWRRSRRTPSQREQRPSVTSLCGRQPRCLYVAAGRRGPRQHRWAGTGGDGRIVPFGMRNARGSRRPLASTHRPTRLTCAAGHYSSCPA